MEKLASLKPAFRENGTVTAGNACGRNDGATALVLMKASEAERLQSTANRKDRRLGDCRSFS